MLYFCFLFQKANSPIFLHNGRSHSAYTALASHAAAILGELVFHPSLGMDEKRAPL